jgi:exodeoxyribonuclease III
LRIATWNINSVRMRIGLIERFVEEAEPDILCLQETKVLDDIFPLDSFEAMGFRHRIVHGMKSYNGVAIFSREGGLPPRLRDAARRDRAA